MYRLASYAAPALEEIYPRTRSQVTAVIDDLQNPMMTSLSYIMYASVEQFIALPVILPSARRPYNSRQFVGLAVSIILL